MPSSSRRCSEPPLSREQCVVAGKILKTRFDPSCVGVALSGSRSFERVIRLYLMCCANVTLRKGLEQLTKSCKTALVISVNEGFEFHGLERSYTLNKLETWTGNSLYRWRCMQKQHKPQSWRPKGEVSAARVAPMMLTAGLMGNAHIHPNVHDAALDAAHGPQRAAHAVRYHNIRPRTTGIAKNLRPDELGTAVKPSTNRLVALSAVCAATLQNVPLLVQPVSIDLQVKPVEPWNCLSATACTIKEGEPVRTPQSNDLIRAL